MAKIPKQKKIKFLEDFAGRFKKDEEIKLDAVLASKLVLSRKVAVFLDDNGEVVKQSEPKKSETPAVKADDTAKEPEKKEGVLSKLGNFLGGGEKRKSAKEISKLIDECTTIEQVEELAKGDDRREVIAAKEIRIAEINDLNGVQQ